MSFDEFVPPWNTYPNQDIDYFYNLKKFPWAPFQLMMSPQRQLPQISVACSVRACSVMSDYVTAWTVARQTPLSMEFSRQEYWSGMPFLPDLPDPGIKPVSPALVGRFFTTEPPLKPQRGRGCRIPKCLLILIAFGAKQDLTQTKWVLWFVYSFCSVD